MTIIQIEREGNNILINEIIVCPQCYQSTAKSNFCNQCGATQS